MKRAKRQRLERRGWAVSDAATFLKLSPEEARLVDIRLSLAAAVRQLRAEQGLTQTDLASRLGSSQSRVAKMEAGDASVSLDLLLRTLVTMGATSAEIGKLMMHRRP